MSNWKIRIKTDQSGLFFALLALLSFAILSVVALLFASGFMAANNARLQNANNMAALSALEEFVRATPASGSPNLTFRQRAELAREQSNSLLDRQELLGGKPVGTPGQLGQLQIEGEGGAGGEIVLGRWFPKRTDGIANPCSPVADPYSPCFERVAPPPPGSSQALPSPSINSVRIRLTTPHSFLSPFLQFLGAGGITLSTESTAAVVPRCVALVLDASASSFEESHPWRGIPNIPPLPAPPVLKPWTAATGCGPGAYCATCPDNAGNPVPIPVGSALSPPFEYSCPRNRTLFAFRVGSPAGEGVGTGTGPFTTNCNSSPYAGLSSTPGTFAEERAIWCNLLKKGGQNRRAPGYAPIPGQEPSQIPQDFVRTIASPDPEYSPYGSVYVDYRNLPQPMANFLLGFNAGLRMLNEQSSQVDRVMMSSFKGRPFYHFPPTGMTADSGFLIEATDARRLEQDKHPNFVDLGWFSLYDDDQPFYGVSSAPPPAGRGSNIIAALNDAINILTNPSNCVESAQKSIILASDGIMNCSFDVPTSTWSCGDTYENYLASEDYLLRTGFNPPQDGGKSLLRRMQDGRITFSMFMAGKSDPHILNRKINNEFLSFDKARTLGFRGMPAASLNPSCAGAANHDVGPCNPYISPLTDTQLFADLRSEEVFSVGVPSICADDPSYGNCNGAGATGEVGRARYAFNNQWQSGVSFRRPVGAFMELALQTGGQFCPFLNIPPIGTAPSMYTVPNGSVDADSVLKDETRDLYVNQRLPWNPSYHTPGQIAGNCALLTLGLNPFVLVADEAR